MVRDQRPRAVRLRATRSGVDLTTPRQHLPAQCSRSVGRSVATAWAQGNTIIVCYDDAAVFDFEYEAIAFQAESVSKGYSVFPTGLRGLKRASRVPVYEISPEIACIRLRQ